MAVGELRRARGDELAAVVALQQGAYAGNRAIMGVEPLPLLADYAEVFRNCEVWVLDGRDGLDGVLILEQRPDDLLIWSIACAAGRAGSGIGNRLLEASEQRAREVGSLVMRLYTDERLGKNVAWYGRHGYAQERIEELSDRRLVHMVKRLD